MAVIDNKKVKDGLVVACEKFAIGEGIKKCVKQQIDSKGPELGDPGKNPYCFKWVYDASATQAADYYQVYAMDRIEITPEISDLIASEPVDMSDYLLPSDPAMLRHVMETHIPLDNVPFDEFFDNTQPVFSPWNNKDASFDIENDEVVNKPTKTEPAKAQPKPTEQPAVKTTPVEPTTPAAGNMIDCPSCKGSGSKRGVQCRVCGGSGQVPGPDEEEPAAATPPAAPKPAAPATPPAQPTATKRVRGAAAPPPPPPPPAQPDDDMDECGNCGKPVPQDASACPHCGVTLD